MLPHFPDFKCLEWSDRNDIEQFTVGFPPYSDFNFTSLYCWDTERKVRIAQLNENLVVLFADYVTGKPFLSFLGSEKVSETALTLLEYCVKYLDEHALRLIPDAVAQSLCQTEFIVTEDRDAFDYVYRVGDLKELHVTASNRSDGARLSRIFTGSYPDHECRCCSLQEADTNAMRKVYIDWALAKGIDPLQTNEYLAFERLIGAKHLDVHAQLMFIDGILKGFQCFEVLSPEYAIAHFCKADIRYKGIYDALMWYTGKTLFEKSIQYYNFEQDLGIHNLRRAKGKYTEYHFLKKFIIHL